jgi:hypothetical protein
VNAAQLLSCNRQRSTRYPSNPVRLINGRYWTAGMVLALMAASATDLAAIQTSGDPRQEASVAPNERVDGYLGIWFTLGQRSEYGDKYSGGLGTYTAKHLPLAIYCAQSEKTFFVYGGTRRSKKHLLAMIGYYDHRQHRVPKPTIVHDKQGVDDPHDNPSLAMDDQGYLWVFVSGRGRHRPGFIYRSSAPRSIESFERIREDEFTYPQPFHSSGRGFFHLFTRYTRGRELYWNTSSDGRSWSDPKKLAGMGGHYQVSNYSQDRIVTVFSMHPGGNVDLRTNMYYVETRDWGKTWSTIDGTQVKVPLKDRKSPAIVRDFQKEGLLVYLKDIRLDGMGFPVILTVISKDHRPGPQQPPRQVLVTRWDGHQWHHLPVTETNHNYDTGCLTIEADGSYRVYFPSDAGPQLWGTGGEVVIWTSRDQGKSWSRERTVTKNSLMNHAYIRRPVGARDPYYVFWADGNPDEFSDSRIYFTNRAGDQIWQLPTEMSGDHASPIEVTSELTKD